MKKYLFLLAAVALTFVGGAIAASTVPIVSTVGTADLVQIIPGGIATAQRYFAYPQQIAGAPAYQNLGAATTGNTYVFGNYTTNMIAQPAGTLAAVTLTAAANPSDGQVQCFTSTQTTTSLTWNANTGQSISGAPTAGVANTQACMIYVKSAATWYRLR